MPVAYPSTVPRPLRATKSRTQPAPFRMAEPRRGYGYVQAIGTDMPVFWDVSWVMTADEAMAFQLWFDLKLSRGLLEFDIPLRTEFGDVAHTCRFMPESLLPASQDGQVWMYTAQIMARKLVRPAIYDEASDLIITLPDWSYWGSLLDQAVTAELPTWYLDILFTRSDTLDPRVTFTRASGATRVNAAGLIETVAANVPRFDYDPVTLAPKGLLIEEQRTNFLTYSEQFDNVGWTKTRASITANTIVAPDGTLTGDKLVEDTTANNTHVVYAPNYSATNTTITATVYAKAGERSQFFLEISNFSTGFGGAVFNLATGVTTNLTNAGDYTNTSASITPVGNGWYRCSVTTTKGSLNSVNRWIIELYKGSTTQYTGDGTSGLYLWGAQLEKGAFPTSYIHTATAAATRAKSSATLQNKFRTTGTILIEHDAPSGQVLLGDGGNTVLVSAGPGKIAFSYDATGSAVCTNGGAVTSGSTVSLGDTLQLLGTTTQAANAHIKRYSQYQYKMSAIELQAITA